MKTSFWKDLLKPVVVLTIICFIVSAALAQTNSITKPIIDANAIAAANATRTALLPEATGFEEIAYEGEGVVSVYRATNDVGYVITGTAKGYGGPVPVVVAFDASGTIIATSISDTGETPGLGKKVEEQSFQEQIWGLPAQQITLGNELVPIAGVTISGAAVVQAVNSAITAYNEVALGVVVVPQTEIEKAAALLGEEELTELSAGVYKGETGYVFATSGEGFEGALVYCLVAIDLDGVIVNISVDASTQTPSLGDKVEKEDFTGQFISMTDLSDVVIIAGATYSSDGVNAAVGSAFEAFAAVKGA